MSILLTTTGVPGTVVINDINDGSNGPLTFNHPVVNLDLLTRYDVDDIRRSVALQTALDNGEITVTIDGRTIINLSLLGVATGNSRMGNLEFVIDAGNYAITVGAKAIIEVPFDCAINQVTMFGNASATVVCDFESASFAAYPGGLATIVAAAPPTLTATDKSQDATLTGWTTNLNAGDVIRLSVSSNDVISQLTVSLRIVER